MADHQHGAVEGQQDLFQQFQGFHVEVVGRFVEYQQVGRLAEQLGQQQARALTTRQRLDRRARTLRTEQEVPQVAEYVAALAVDVDKVAAFSDVVDHGLFQVQLVAQLVKVGHVDASALFDLAAGRLQAAEHQLEQGGLAGTVGAQQADTVATLQDHGEVLDQERAVRVMEADVLQHHHLLARLVGSIELDIGLAGTLAALTALDAQGFQGTHAAFVTGATGLDALADPDFFLGQFLVEQRVGGFFGSQGGFLVHQKAGVVAVPVDQAATVQFEDARGQALQESTVVRDKQHGALEVLDGFFKPGNGADVQVVGRFVEQQQVRLGHQGLGQQHATTPAAGQFGEGLVGRQLQAAQGAVHQLLQAPAVTGFEVLLDVHQLVEVFLGDAVLRQVMVLREQLANAVQAFGNHVEHCPSVGHRQFLRQFADLEARGTPHRAVIGLLVAFYQLHHAGLAGAVAADDAHPLTTGDLPGHLVQQRHGAESKGHIAEFEQGHTLLQKLGAHST